MRTRVDRIYTPQALAGAMVDTAGIESLGSEHYVADFAAGDGELLIAARAKWPSANIIATDIDPAAVRLLRSRAMAGWRVGICDFLSPRSRAQCSPLKQQTASINLVLLNPPFSCRGGRRVSATVSGDTVKCSIGLAFVVNSIDYLAHDGVIVAVLPCGSMTSEKDCEAWEVLHSLGEVNVPICNSHRTFPGATIRTCVIRFQKGRRAELCVRTPEGTIRTTPSVVCERGSVILVRGTTQMHQIRFSTDHQGVPLIHSTELREGGPTVNRFVENERLRVVKGPMVLVPRVGNPKQTKVICYTGNEAFALSDCVLAALCETGDDARQLCSTIRDNWALLEQSYGGSGARYLTLRRFTTLLKAVGYAVAIRE